MAARPVQAAIVRAPIAQLKQGVDLRALAAETHEVNRAGKVLCPFHDDSHPSCHLYDDGFKCFSCGVAGDIVDWLERVHDLSTAEAIKRLEGHAGAPTTAPARRSAPAPHKRQHPAFRPVSDEQLAAHYERAAALCRVPAALKGRGFTLDDCKALGIAELHDDALLPITGPTGEVLAIKRRFAKPRGRVRYSYLTPGCGTPAWCSPGFLDVAEALVIEGELNGMAAWFARPSLGVQGCAGAEGPLHLDALKGKKVYIYADGDDPGQRARERWASEAHRVAQRVYVLEPWEMDACDIAGKQGRAALTELLS